MVVDVVQRYLALDGIRVLTAATGPAALALALERLQEVGLIVLDVMLPGQDGMEICRYLRSEVGATMPIILLTARGEESDRVRGLALGADYYVVKPFSPRELVARIKAQLRRVQLDRESGPLRQTLQAGDIVLDPGERTCMVLGSAAALTPKEFDLLHYLMEHQGKAYSRNDLLDAIWDEEYVGDPSTVTVHVRRLREKVERDPDRPAHIKTVWGLGYKFAIGVSRS
ncbi:MAG: response regulator [Chloroflexi bacterium]|nr:response regulator [Chloroflexota bacterium]